MKLPAPKVLEPWGLMEDKVFIEEGVALLTFLLEKNLVEAHLML